MSWIGYSIAGFIVVGIGLYVIGIYNGLIALKHNIDQAWSNIDVLLKQRSDELPKLVDTVKGYVKHESAVLTRVTELRSAMMNARGVEEQGRADSALRGALGKLFAVSEEYPALRADSAFQQLQERISDIEDQISDRREFYNHSVNAYNVRIEQIPDVFVAQLLQLVLREHFEADESDRQDVEISF